MNNQYNWFKLLGLDDTLIICTLIFIVSLILVRIIIKKLDQKSLNIIAITIM